MSAAIRTPPPAGDDDSKAGPQPSPDGEESDRHAETTGFVRQQRRPSLSFQQLGLKRQVSGPRLTGDFAIL